MQLIKLNDLGSGSLDLGHFRSQGSNPLVNRHMTKAHNAANRSKSQALQIQGHRQSALVWSGGIGFVVNRKQGVAFFALVTLAPIEDATFDSGCTGTSGTCQHRRLLRKIRRRAQRISNKLTMPNLLTQYGQQLMRLLGSNISATHPVFLERLSIDPLSAFH
jgi:hypothetical protein